MIQDPYFITPHCIERLIKAYEKHKNLLIGFDFDDTIFDFHKQGHTYPFAIEILKECSDLGFTMILITAKEKQEDIDYVVEHCKSLGIKVDYINESPAMKSIKPFVNIYLDDKAGLGQAFNILRQTLDKIKG